MFLVNWECLGLLTATALSEILFLQGLAMQWAELEILLLQP